MGAVTNNMDELELELTGSEPVVTPETPSPEVPAEVKVETPESPVVETPEVPAEVLYDLPDGRKVNAATLEKEWKENFLPDYTRKSQRIAEIDRGPKDITKPNSEPWRQPDYVPKDYAELVEIAKQEAVKDIQSTYEREQERVRAIQQGVETEIAEIKKLDPQLNEGVLFQHANKYGFQNLMAAHKNMTDLKAATLDAEQRTIKNLKVREVDPVSSGASGGMAEDDGYDPANMSQFSSATEYLARLKGK